MTAPADHLHAHEQAPSDAFADAVKAHFERLDGQLQALVAAALLSGKLRQPGFVLAQRVAAEDLVAASVVALTPAIVDHIAGGYIRGRYQAQRDWLGRTDATPSERAALAAARDLMRPAGAGPLADQLLDTAVFGQRGFRASTAADAADLTSLLDEATSKLSSLERLVGDNVETTLRAAVRRELGSMTPGDDPEQAAKRLASSIEDAGVTHTGTHRKLGKVRMVKVGGRNLQLADYVDRIVRTLPRIGASVATLNFAREVGHNLFQVSEHWPTCDLCASHRGAIYSAEQLTGVPLPPFHPHCWHVLRLYFGPVPA